MVPHFRQPNVVRRASLDWVFENVTDLQTMSQQGRDRMFAKHEAEKAE